MRFIFLFFVLFVLGCVPSEKTDLAIPAYFYPDSKWDVLSQKDDLKIIIVNPSDGVGKKIDLNYVTAINKVKEKQLYGYVYTKYGKRSLTEVKQEIVNYQKFYGITNIFLDEVSSEWKEYYGTAIGYVSGKLLSIQEPLLMKNTHNMQIS